MTNKPVEGSAFEEAARLLQDEWKDGPLGYTQKDVLLRAMALTAEVTRKVVTELPDQPCECFECIEILVHRLVERIKGGG